MTREAFLEQILAKPEDDTPRLIFADWLEEHGDPRGEFIRLQCQLARIGNTPAPALQSRAARLLNTHRDSWMKDVNQHLRAGALFDRGFIRRWSLSIEELAESGDAVFRIAPLLRSIQIQGDADSALPPLVVQQVANMPQLQRLQELRLHGEFRSATLAAILSSAYLDKLQTLDIRYARALDTQLLVRDGSFTSLQSLRVEHCNIGDNDAQNIAGARCFPSLQTLRVGHNAITAPGVRAIVRAQRLSQVSNLDFASNLVADDGALALAATASSNRFRWLGLANTHVTDLSAQPLAHSRQLTDLEGLDLRGNRAISQSVRRQLRDRYGEKLWL